jgi:hypothetical protein
MDFLLIPTAIKDDVEIPLDESIRGAVSMNQVNSNNVSSEEKKLINGNRPLY